eukprot:1346244-Rhodomonas_salina.1
MMMPSGTKSAMASGQSGQSLSIQRVVWGVTTCPLCPGACLGAAEGRAEGTFRVGGVVVVQRDDSRGGEAEAVSLKYVVDCSLWDGAVLKDCADSFPPVAVCQDKV